MATPTPHKAACTYLQEITEAAEKQAREAGKPWPDVLHIRPPMTFEEAEALACWLKVAKEQRGSPVRVQYLWCH